MKEGWDERRRRAEQLVTAGAASAPLLSFYAAVLTCQGEIDRFLGSRPDWQPSGSLERDLVVLGPQVPDFVRRIASIAPLPLAAQGEDLLNGPPGRIDEILLAWWSGPSDRAFFPKAILQPYARRLADAQITLSGRVPVHADNRCPFCGGVAQLSVLHTTDPSGGGGRRLLCATCLTAWPFRRVRCVQCGEEDERRLGYFRSPAFDHLRVDVCETCRRYLKTVDLTRLGIAVPLVDEVAGTVLDVWARDCGYEKVELNLVGM